MTTQPSGSGERRYVRVGEAARLTGVPTRELFRRIDEGRLTARLNKAGMVVIPAEDVDTITP